MFKKSYTPEHFVRVWTNATSPQAAAKRLGMSVFTVRSMASLYRSKGIPLKRFPGGVPHMLDIKALSKIAKGGK